MIVTNRLILTASVILGVVRGGAAQTLPAVGDVPAFRTDNFLLVPAAIVSGGEDTNIHREGPPNGPIAAGELFAVAGVQMFGMASAFEFSGSSGAEIVAFKDNPGEGGLSWAHRVGLRVALPRIRPKASLRYSDTYARPSGFEIGERSRHQELAIGAGVDVRLSPRATLGGEVNHLALNYDAAAVYQDSSLYETLSLDLLTASTQLSYDLTPLTTVSGTATIDQSRFRRASSRDTDGGLVAVSVSMSRPALLSGRGQVGLRWFRALNGGADTFVGLTGAADLLYFRPNGISIQTRFARDTQFSYDPALAYYVFTDVGATLLFKPAGWSIGFGAGHQWLDYRYAGTAAGAGRVDHRTGIGGVLGHRVGRGMEVGVNAEYLVKRGNLPFTGARAMAYWSLGSAFLMRFDRPLPGELP